MNTNERAIVTVLANRSVTDPSAADHSLISRCPARAEHHEKN